MSDDIEKVELDESAADAIADKVADRLPKSDEEPAWAKAIREENAELKAMLTTPKRTEIPEPVDGKGAAPKPGENPVYGGHDMYSLAGHDDASVATNLWLAQKAVSLFDRSGSYRPSQRLREVMVRSAEAAVKAGPRDIPQFIKTGYNGTKAIDPDGFVRKTAAEYRSEVTKAMTSTGANVGDEWVPTFASSELWTDVHLATAVTASIPRVAMPTNPYTLPTIDADPTPYYASTENTAVTGSQPNTGNATLTARKINIDVTFSGEVTEDSIIPIAPTVRATLVRRSAQVMDDLIIHGDTETGGTGNVNSDDAAPAAGSFYLALDGMRKFCLVTNTGQASQLTAALSATNFTTARALLLRFGVRTDDVRCVVGPALWYAAQDIGEIQTLDQYGPNATIITGELARFFGIPILLSEAIPSQTTDKVDDDGKYTTTSPSTNDTDGWFVLYNRQQWRVGFRRELTIESDRNIQTDSNILVSSFRMALIPSGISTAHTVVGYDVTV